MHVSRTIAQKDDLTVLFYLRSWEPQVSKALTGASKWTDLQPRAKNRYASHTFFKWLKAT